MPFVDGRALPPPSGLRHMPIHCYAIFNRKLIFGLKYFNSHTRELTRVCCAQLVSAASYVKNNCIIVCCSISATDSYKKPGKIFLLRMGPFPVDGHKYGEAVSVWENNLFEVQRLHSIIPVQFVSGRGITLTDAINEHEPNVLSCVPCIDL